MQEKIAILGAGSWGNTLAFLLGQNKPIVLWDHNEKRVRRVNKTRRFKKPLAQRYPDNVQISSDLNDVIACPIIINAISVKGIVDVFQQLKAVNIPESTIIVNGSKGVESNKLLRPSELIRSILKNNPIAVLSGPNLAAEVVRGKPMVTVIAAENQEIADRVQTALLEPTLRIYTNTDVVGVELAGALKNIMAIACGCLDGLELGISAKASLITRGLAEMTTFILYHGGHVETLLGAAGIGDLIATSSSRLSRNYSVGYNLAKGKKLDEIINALGEVAEGVNTCYAVHKICLEKNIQMPIVTEMKAILDNESTPVEAVLNLMNRPVGSEQKF